MDVKIMKESLNDLLFSGVIVTCIMSACGIKESLIIGSIIVPMVIATVFTFSFLAGRNND
ncbi:MAG: hypothetical protein ACRCTZ_08205 [Sarcina sp.]